MSTYDAGENAIIVEGELMEKRLQEYYLMSGEKRPSGVLHNMIIRFIAEGPEQVELLRSLGVTLGQGFLFAAPLPLPEPQQWAVRSLGANGPVRPDR
mgnify:CR=1 FL=1